MSHSMIGFNNMALGIDKAILGGGLLLIGGTVFAESGLLIGFFLPGDTLLFGAGILASQGVLQIHTLIVVIIVSAILGDNVGYSIGHRTGKRLFHKKESILFKPDHLEKAEKFYEAHGGKTIIMARFIPMVRTFAPMVAGIGKMSRRRFLVFNMIGATLWGGGVTLLGYWFGSRMPWIENYISLVLLAVISVSFGVSLFHILRDGDNRRILSERILRYYKQAAKKLSRK